MNSRPRQSMAPMKIRSASRVMALVGTFAAAAAAHAGETAPTVDDVRGGTLGYVVVHKLHEVRATTRAFEAFLREGGGPTDDPGGPAPRMIESGNFGAP